MRKRIGIVTIANGTPNFGNKLQNYAVQSIIEKLGFEAETILDCRWMKNPRKLSAYCKDIIHVLTRYKYHPNHFKRIRFRFWSEKYLHYCPVILKTNKDLSILSNRFDCCFVGSDQLWNPEYQPDGFSFASFMKNGGGRIAISPSFGVDYIPVELKKLYQQYLTGFAAMSVREDTGAKMIKELTGDSAVVLIDPTMMLSTEEWDKILTLPPIEKDYVLFYHLGEVTLEYNKYVQDICARLATNRVIDLSMKKYGAINPSEFIGYIKKAKYIITDSFHCCVFSILYDKSFTVFQRMSNGGSMWSRMETLFNKFKISMPNCSIFEVPCIVNKSEILEQERTLMWKYLNDSINNVKQ